MTDKQNEQGTQSGSVDLVARVAAVLGLAVAIFSLIVYYLQWRTAADVEERSREKLQVLLYRKSGASFDSKYTDSYHAPVILSTWNLDILNISTSSPLVVKSVSYQGYNSDYGISFHYWSGPPVNFPDRIDPFVLKNGDAKQKTLHVYVPMNGMMRSMWAWCRCKEFAEYENYMREHGLDELGNTLINASKIGSGVDYGKPLYNLGVKVVATTASGNSFEYLASWKAEALWSAEDEAKWVEVIGPPPKKDYSGLMILIAE